MPQAALPIISAAAPVVGGLIGKAVGPKTGTTTPQLPQDLAQPRQNSINLMQYLLGFGGQNPTAGANGAQGFGGGGNTLLGGMFGGNTMSGMGGINGPSVQGMNAGAVNFGGGGNPLGGMLGTQPRTGGMPQLMPQAPGGEGFSAPLSPQGGRVESVFGPTGVQSTPLQRQSTGGIQQFLNQQSPESRTNDLLNPGLNQVFGGGVGMAGGPTQGNLLSPEVLASLTKMATGQTAGQAIGSGTIGGAGMEGADFLRNLLKQAPGQGLIDALQPGFQRGLAEANQAGGRFGTANAVMRSRALEDYNLLAAQAGERGLDRQMDAANRLAQLGINSGAANAGLQNSFNQSQQAAVDALLRSAQGGGQLAQGAVGLGQNAAFGAGGLMGNLAGQAGGSDFQRLLQAYGVGSSQAAQNDVGTQRNLGILMNMLGQMNQATLGAPVQTSPNGAAQGSALGGQIGSLIALLGGGGGGAKPAAPGAPAPAFQPSTGGIGGGFDGYRRFP